MRAAFLLCRCGEIEYNWAARPHDPAGTRITKDRIMTTKAIITLVDIGIGNLHSVQKALERAGGKVLRTESPADVRTAQKIVLPGVGAFGDYMAELRTRGMDEALLHAIARGAPLLGICVGMQALFEVGREMGEHCGLGLLKGSVECFSEMPGYKIPQTGWNQIWPRGETPLLKGIPAGSYVYFNHSYYCIPGEDGDVAATTDYGIDYASYVRRGALFGVQFHPEKSQQVGLNLLKNFIELE